MKLVVCFFALCLTGFNGLEAQTLIIDHHPSRAERSPFIVSGIVIGTLGCGGILYGALANISGSSNITSAERNTDLAVMGAGIGLFALGGGLLYAGLTREHYFKWGVISPKRNEIGLAYNFK